MLDRLETYLPQLQQPEQWAVATVISTSGSAPRAAGASMLVHESGRCVGSVSGGCVEAAVVDAAMTMLQTGASEVIEFGYSDHDGLGVGLTCGGSLEVHIQPLSALQNILPILIDYASRDNHPVALVQSVQSDRQHILELVDLSEPVDHWLLCQLPRRTQQQVRAALKSGTNTVVPLLVGDDEDCQPDGRLVIQTRLSAPRLLIYGANDFAAALAAVARPLGWHITVCDARSLFATAARQPHAHEVVVETPVTHLRREFATGAIDPRTSVVVLGHDPRFDLEILVEALSLPLSYVGAMGSRKTHQKRVEDLLKLGLDESALGRLHSPIGLDIGAGNPAEIAISILGEIIVSRNSASAEQDQPLVQIQHLKDTRGPVQTRTPAARK
ncbi:XdhC family protein [Micrococcoides hystricis]|uniref:XdhC family protein n=1 Tax=Micrococcoides hystricis TaxID=1572761 RepID=A0ABV6PAY7_9MICC